MVTPNEDETVPEMPKEKPFSFEDIAAPRSDSGADNSMSSPEGAVSDSVENATNETPVPAFSPDFPDAAPQPVPDLPVEEPVAPPMPAESTPATIEQTVSTLKEEAAVSEDAVVFPPPLTFPEAPAEPVPDMPAEELPAMPTEDSTISVDSTIPDMPVGEAPETDPNAPSRYVGLGDDEGQNDKPDSLAVLNAKLEAGVDKAIAWAKPRQSFLIKFGIIAAAVIFLAVTTVKLSVVPVVSMTVKNVLADIGMKDASFTVTYADTQNVILSNLQSADGTFSAKELIIVYSLTGLFLSKTIDEVNINGMQVAARLQDGKFIAPFIAGDSSSAQGIVSAPEYTIKFINASQSKAVLQGTVNGSASFSFKGSLDKDLKFSAPITLDTDILKGSATFNMSGWQGDLDVSVTTKDMNFTDARGYTGLISMTDAKVAFERGMFKRADFNANYRLGQYKMNIKSDIKYINDKFDADITLNTSVEAKEAIVATPTKRSRFSRRNRQATAVVAPLEVSDEKMSSLPTGDLKISIKQAALDSNNGFKGDLPIKVSSQDFSWKNIKVSNAKIDFDGNLSCAEKSCSYTLNKNSFLSLDKVSFPVMKFGFEAMEKMNLELTKIDQPLFIISANDLLFNIELKSPALTGSVAEVKSSNVFLLEAQRLFAEGSINIDGGFETDITIANFNFSDSSYLLNKADAVVTLSSNNSPSIKLKADMFKEKSAGSIITPSSVMLETKPTPQDNIHQFKLVLQQKDFATSQIFSGNYDYYKGRVVANFSIPEIKFSKKLQPKQIFPFVGDYLTDVRGNFSAEGTVTWSGVSFSGPARFTFKDFSASKGYAKLSGLNSTFSVTNFNPITTGKPQRVKASNLDILLPFKNVDLKVGVSPSGLIVSDFSASLAGGKVDTLETLSVPYSLNASPYMLLVKGAQFKDLSSIANVPATMTGSFDARLPVTLRSNDVSITLGDISTTGAGSFKSKAKPSANASDFAKVMSDVKFTKITGTVDSSLKKDTNLQLNVEGTNPSVNNGEPFKQTVKYNAKTSSLLK